MAMHCHNTPGLPDQTPVLSPDQWAELHDMLTLALDALGDRPEDFSPDFLANAVIHQRLASRITSKAARRIGGVV